MDLSLYWETIVDTLQDGVMVVDPPIANISPPTFCNR